MIRDLVAIGEFLWNIGSSAYVYAPFLGLVVGLLLTQFVKYMFQFSLSRRLIQGFAAWVAFTVVALLTWDWIGIVLAAAVGMLCPMLYQVIVWRLYKRWPRLESILSGDLD